MTETAYFSGGLTLDRTTMNQEKLGWGGGLMGDGRAVGWGGTGKTQ